MFCLVYWNHCNAPFKKAELRTANIVSKYSPEIMKRMLSVSSCIYNCVTWFNVNIFVTISKKQNTKTKKPINLRTFSCFWFCWTIRLESPMNSKKEPKSGELSIALYQTKIRSMWNIFVAFKSHWSADDNETCIAV